MTEITSNNFYINKPCNHLKSMIEDHQTEVLMDSNKETLENLPKIPSIGSMMNNVDIDLVINEMKNNPENFSRKMDLAREHMDPDMMEEARKIAQSGQGQDMLKKMQKRGVNTQELKNMHKGMEQRMKGQIPSTENMKKVIFITASRQMKSKMIHVDSENVSIINLLKSEEAVELSCSRLAVGPLTGKTIKIWCNTSLKSKNPRLSKIAGFPVGGEAVIIMKEGDLLADDFRAAEKLLEKS